MGAASVAPHTVNDTTHVGALSVLSQYMAASFTATNTGQGGSLVADPPSSSTILVGATALKTRIYGSSS